MKNPLYFLGLLSLLSFSALAQTEQGTWLVGVAGNGASRRVQQTQNTNILFTPHVAYFVSRNVALGGQLSVDYTRRTFDTHLISSSTATGANALARFYIGDWKVRPYVNVLAGYAWHRAQGSDVITGQPTRFRGDEKWNASVGAGVAYFVAPKVALEADVNYRYFLRGDFDSRKNAATTFRLGLSLYLK
ncbi:outer membrane protein [Telluribacter sp. SYSU D00476]|uniref:outer membrane protein n=1 Tax=Telluribacter sp. SYSU D00476 TaxID=2811430 RepID=UPI001FF5674E|nr:outer membrane beta-barrel protein [Telluribacter sp. SYSU D00476]